jgi:hypothetical protein
MSGTGWPELIKPPRTRSELLDDPFAATPVQPSG